MKHGSLFSGIGGFDLAAQWIGWENVFHCEINPFCQKILNHYWPKADSLSDIKKTDFKKYEGQIDIISGGFPCQPYSLAGQRKGTEDDRHLWPEMLRAIREIKPKWIVGENVYGLVNWNGGLVFEEVHTDLEAEGYEVWAVILPAVSKDAPHRRDRVWFIAYANECSTRSSRKSEKAEKDRSDNNHQQGSGKQQAKQCNGCSDVLRPTPNADSARIPRQPTNFTTSKEIRQGGEIIEANGNFKLIGGWQTFPTQSPICGGNDGIPTELDGITFSKWRNESIKGYGNAVVPQVVFEIFKVINKIQYDVF